MIFISGVHGVGKSYFCKMVENSTGIESYSASNLISQKKQSGFTKNKLIPDIDENQQYLLMAVNELRKLRKEFILDGHFCLLNSLGEISRIPYVTFEALKPDAIVLLMEKPDIIALRRKERDGVNVSVRSIDRFQQEELVYTKEIASNLYAKLFISNGMDDLAQAMKFIKSL